VKPNKQPTAETTLCQEFTINCSRAQLR